MKVNPIARALMQSRRRAQVIPNKKKFYQDKFEQELDDLWHCRDLKRNQDEESKKARINKRS